MKKRFWILMVSLAVFTISPAAMGKDVTKHITGVGEGSAKKKWFNPTVNGKPKALIYAEERAFEAAKKDAESKCPNGKLRRQGSFFDIVFETEFDDETDRFIVTTELDYKCIMDNDVTDKDPRVTTNRLKPGEILIGGKIFVEKPAEAQPAL